MASSVDDNVIEGLQTDDDDKAVMIFGRDVSKIPCFKDSLLTGIYGGVGCGIASFLLTSQAPRSTHVSVISFGVITLGYWFHCRYKWAQQHFITKQSEGSFGEDIERASKKPKSF